MGHVEVFFNMLLYLVKCKPEKAIGWGYDTQCPELVLGDRCKVSCASGFSGKPKYKKCGYNSKLNWDGDKKEPTCGSKCVS